MRRILVNYQNGVEKPKFMVNCACGTTFGPFYQIAKLPAQCSACEEKQVKLLHGRLAELNKSQAPWKPERWYPIWDDSENWPIG